MRQTLFYARLVKKMLFFTLISVNVAHAQDVSKYKKNLESVAVTNPGTNQLILKIPWYKYYLKKLQFRRRIMLIHVVQKLKNLS